MAAWGDGEPIVGTPFRQVVTAAQTDGRIVALSVDMPPGLRTDEHSHDDEDQISIVIEGTVGCTVDGIEHVATAGGVLIAPKGHPHVVFNAGEGFAKVIELYTPAGFEQVFIAAGARAAGGEATGDDYAAARSR